MSSRLSTKHRWSWNGVSQGTWVGATMSSTMSSARSACPSGECAHVVMTTSTSRHATLGWPSAAWRCATCKLTRSTALRSRRSTAFPTRVPIRLSSLQWTSPQIRLVGAVSSSDDECETWRCSYISKLYKRWSRKILYAQEVEINCLHACGSVLHILLFEKGLRRKTVFWMGLGKGPLSNTHNVLSANTAANSNSEAECIHNVEPSVFQQPTASSPPLYQPTPDNIRVKRTLYRSEQDKVIITIFDRETMCSNHKMFFNTLALNFCMCLFYFNFFIQLIWPVKLGTVEKT